MKPIHTLSNRLLLAFISGLLLIASQPLMLGEAAHPLLPGYVQPLFAWTGFALLFHALSGAGPLMAYLTGLSAGLVYFMGTLYWVVVAMHVFGNLPMSTALLLLALLSFVVAQFWALALLLAAWFAKRGGRFGLYVVLLLTCAEFFRSLGFLAFPWPQPGYTFAPLPLLAQGAALLGVNGLTLLVLAQALLLTRIYQLSRAGHHEKARARRWQLLATLGAQLAFGALHLIYVERLEAHSPHLKTALLQGNIEQGIKNHAAQNSALILSRYQKLVTTALDQGATLLIWPESAWPLFIDRDTRQLALSPSDPNTPQPPAGVWHVIGAPTLTQENRALKAIYNSVVLTDNAMNIHSFYDKTHLVPFGEYMPLRGILPGDKFVPGMSDFSPGAEIRPLQSPLAALGPLICYEGIFPEISAEHVRHGAQALINVTNDAWFGISSAPFQHLAFYPIRAIETGRAIARAANTGVSALIHPTGAITDRTEIYTERMQLIDLPLMSHSTLYVRLPQDLFCWIIAGFLLLSALAHVRVRGRA